MSLLSSSPPNTTIRPEEPKTAATEPIRVLLIAHSFTPEGNRKQLAELGSNLKLRVLAPGSFRETWDPAPPPEPVNYEWREFAILQFFPHQYFALSGSLGMRNLDPDVIHVDYPPWSLIYWQCLLFRTLFARRAKIVSTAKKNTFRIPRGIRGVIKRLLARMGARTANHFEASSALSKSMLEDQIGVDASSISVVPHMGVDTQLFCPSPGNEDAQYPIVVGFCGKYSDHKGLKVLLEAVQLLRDSGTDLELRLLGSGPMGDDLKSLAADEGWIHVGSPSSSSGVAKFMAGLDIYVLPALICPDHQEHDGHALIQALASGVPSVGTDSGIIPDILGSGSGIIVPPGEVDSLATAIGNLATDSALRLSYSEASLDLVSRKYSLQAVAEARRNMYREILGLASLATQAKS